MTRRDGREYRVYLMEEQRSQAGCSARRMQAHFHHGLQGHDFDEDIFSASLSVREMKQMHYDSVNVMRSRSSKGHARRRA